MSAPDTDRLIDAWLREELDAVPEPTRALQGALDAAAVTAQNRGRLHWLRLLLGLDTSFTQHGRPERPEIVLSPPGGPSGTGTAVVSGAGSTSLPVIVAAALAVVVLAAVAAWLVIGPGSAMLGGSQIEGTTSPEQPQRPLDPPGPDRVIVVDPAEGHFSTIAGAVAAAEPGDRIELHPGTYQAEVVIDEDITIAGVGDRDTIVVESLPPAPGEAVTDRLHVIFTLRASDATLQGFTLRGSSNGTAVAVEGGAPLIDDLVIDPEGDMRTAGPAQPRESLSVTGAARPTIRNSVLTSLAGVSGGAAPLFEDVAFEGGCLLVEGEGTSPTVRDTDFVGSECPGFSVSVSAGARTIIEASPIESLPGNAGIRVANEGSSAEISGTGISGGREGVYVWGGAAVTLHRSNAQGADIGVRVLDAELVLQDGAIIGNGVGLEVSGDSYLETVDTDICDNDRNLDLRDGAMVPFELNRVCVDGTSELVKVDGS